jgi:hypothetical protein
MVAQALSTHDEGGTQNKEQGTKNVLGLDTDNSDL